MGFLFHRMQKLSGFAQPILSFSEPWQFKLSSLYAYSTVFYCILLYSILFWARKSIFEFTVTPASPPQSCPSICICVLNVMQTCTWQSLYFSLSLRGAPRPQSIYLLFIKWWFPFPIHRAERPWERGIKRKGGGTESETRYKETKERYKQKRHKKCRQKDWWNQRKMQRTERAKLL